MLRSHKAALFALFLASAFARADVAGPQIPIEQAIPREPPAGRSVADVPAAPSGADPLSLHTPLESRPLGARRAPGVSAANHEPQVKAGTPANPQTIPLAGVIGPLSIVILSIVVLAGIVVVIARSRGGLAASLSAGGKAPAGILEVLGRYPLGGGMTLVLLKFDRRVLLLTQSSVGRLGRLQLSPLCELDQPEDVASILLKVREADQVSLAGRFSAVFKSLDRQAAQALDAPPVSLAPSPVLQLPAPRRASHAPKEPEASSRGTTAVGAESSVRRRVAALKTGRAE